MKGRQTSQLETEVAAVLALRHIPFLRQVSVGGFFTVDFRIGYTLLEVNGCWIHGCRQCIPRPLDWQIKHRQRDARLASWCRNRGVPLVTIWEHEIRAGDFRKLDGILSEGGTRSYPKSATRLKEKP